MRERRRRTADGVPPPPHRRPRRSQETFAALKEVDYDGYLTIEAFGQGLPLLAAATKIWRKMFEDEDMLASEGLAFMKQCWGE